MKAIRTLFLTLLMAALVCLSPMAARAQTAPAPDTFTPAVATEWLTLALQLSQQTPGFSPPVTARALAYIGLTLHESQAPGMVGKAGYSSFAGQLNELESLPWAQPDEPLHWPTVANAALATMTRMMFSNASAENKARIDLLERSLPLKITPDFDPTSTTPEITQRSESFGKLMAMAIMTWARTDGGHEAWGPLRRSRENYVPPSGQGLWSATPPGFAAPLLPWWGTVRPFVLRAPSDCPAPPPPAFSEAPDSAFHQAASEVHRISTQATQAQRQFALYWADDAGKTPTPAGHWAFIATDLLKAQTEQKKSHLAEAGKTYALLNMAMADAFTTAWATKYAVNLMRPVTYVQNVIDSTWVPTLMATPNFPEYPSGHSVQSSAAAVVLGSLFGANTGFTDNTHNDRGWGPRRFNNFKAAADEASLSRLYAGIHYRFGVGGGQVQGACVGAKVLALKMTP